MSTRIYNNDEKKFFPIYAALCEREHFQENVSRPHGFNLHQLFIVIDGTGILNICEKCYLLEKGDMFFISADVPHSYFGEDEYFKISYFSFFGDGFSMIKNYYKSGDYGVYKNKSCGIFDGEMVKIIKAMDDYLNVPRLSVKAYSTVIAFFEESYSSTLSPTEKVFEYINENYSLQISLDDILLIYPYSKSKLFRDFRAMYKMTVFEMLIKIRLEHASYSLRMNPQKKLESIAADCGFNDTSYFCKMFKQAYGTSPKSIVK